MATVDSGPALWPGPGWTRGALLIVLHMDCQTGGLHVIVHLSFKERLLKNGGAAVAELGINAGGWDQGQPASDVTGVKQKLFYLARLQIFLKM